MIHTSEQNMTEQTKDAQIKQNSLNGTWNLVNETNSGMSNMSMDDMNNMTGTSGTITFGKGGSTRFVQNYDGIHQGNYWVNWLTQKLHLGYDMNSWKCCTWFSIDLTFKTISPNHIELTDSHGDTIRLMRNG